MPLNRFVVLVLCAAALAACSRTPASDTSRLPRPRPRRRASASICSSAWTTRRWCSCTPTASRRCRCARRRSSGTCTQAAIAGRDIYYDQKHRHALDDARRARGDRARTPQGVDAGHARRDPALHQAVLDQQRAVQQPDRAQVRPEDDPAGVRRGARSRRRRTARRSRPPAGEIARRAADAAAADVLRRRASIRSSPTRRPAPGQGHPDRQRQQPLLRRQPGRPEGVHGAVRRSTRGW